MCVCVCVTTQIQMLKLQKWQLYIVGPEGPRGFGPFHLKPKAHAEEEEVPGDEMKGIQTARMYCRGRPCPRQAKIMGEKAATSPEDIHSRITKEIPSHMG